MVKVPTLIGWNQAAGNIRPIALPAPVREDTGTSRPEKFTTGMMAENRGCKDCRYLGPGEGRDELPETARGENVEQSPEREGSEGSLDRHVENDIRHQHHEDERQHPDDDIGELLAHEEFEFADGRGAKIGDRAGFLLAHDTDGRHDRRDQNQHYHDDARNHGEDALESLVVAEAIFDIDAAEVDVGYGVRAKTLELRGPAHNAASSR